MEDTVKVTEILNLKDLSCATYIQGGLAGITFLNKIEALDKFKGQLTDKEKERILNTKIK